MDRAHFGPEPAADLKGIKARVLKEHVIVLRYCPRRESWKNKRRAYVDRVDVETTPDNVSSDHIMGDSLVQFFAGKNVHPEWRISTRL